MLDNILIIGTSHISSNSLTLIKKSILEFKPDIIAVELDADRLYGLQHPNNKNKSSIFSQIKQLGFSGFIFAHVGKFVQNKLGSIVKLKPGSDMLYAVKLAKNNNLQLELIDRHINITLKRFSKEFGFREKLRLIKDILLAPFSKKNKIKFDISKIPEDELVSKLIEQVKYTYPSIHRVLIDERNKFMSKKLIILHKKNPNKKILAVVGAGHKIEMEKLIEKYNSSIELI